MARERRGVGWPGTLCVHARARRSKTSASPIDCLPLRTREAMLEGIRANDIIVGAYTDRSGGICPMLAAHRHGGRTSFVSFAHAWDRFAGAKRAAPRHGARAARPRAPAGGVDRSAEADLGGAIADHQAHRPRAPGARGAPRRPRLAARAPRRGRAEARSRRSSAAATSSALRPGRPRAG